MSSFHGNEEEDDEHNLEEDEDYGDELNESQNVTIHNLVLIFYSRKKHMGVILKTVPLTI